MRQRFYIFLVRHDADGQLRRTPIRVQWVVTFVACAVVGAVTLLGLAGSYLRMLGKVREFNSLRHRQTVLLHELDRSRHEAHRTRVEMASLGTLAGEVASLYDLRHNLSLRARMAGVETSAPGLYQTSSSDLQLLRSWAARRTVLGPWRWDGPRVWRPSMWPVNGRISSSFGQRIDPLTGEGEFHTGVDIAAPYGSPVRVTADGRVVFAGFMTGYGRLIIVYDGHGIKTYYAHLSRFAVTVGERVLRGQILGYLGESGWTTGPCLHYEVRIDNTPVNPYPYLFARRRRTENASLAF